MNFIENLFGIENQWAVLGILVLAQIIICVIVCKSAKKPAWGWLTLVLTGLFIIVYIWKFHWLFVVVGTIIAFGPADLIVGLLLPEGESKSVKPVTPFDPYHPVSKTIANFGPRSQSYYNSLRGKTVHHPLSEKLYEYVAFLCVDILGVNPSAVTINSDFNNDLGADATDMNEFVKHLAEEIFMPKAYLEKARTWLQGLVDQAARNRENDSYLFPVNTVRDMVNALESFLPERIQYPS